MNEEPHELLTDRELCAVLRITSKTLSNYLKHGPPSVRHKTTGDIRLIQHVTMGGIRRWSRKSLDRFLTGKHMLVTSADLLAAADSVTK